MGALFANYKSEPFRFSCLYLYWIKYYLCCFFFKI